jgi:hypothetical protein
MPATEEAEEIVPVRVLEDVIDFVEAKEDGFRDGREDSLFDEFGEAIGVAEHVVPDVFRFDGG